MTSSSAELASGCDTMPIAPGYIGWWSFDEGQGDQTADLSGNGAMCTLGAGALARKPAWIDGRAGKALSFDGVDDILSCGNGAHLNVRGPITVEAWVRPGATAAHSARILSKGEYSLYPFELILKKPAGPNNFAWWLGMEVAGNKYGYADPVVAALEWTHVAMVYDRTTVKVYVNGTATTPGTPYSDLLYDVASRGLYMGSRHNGTYPFQGAIDEVRIYPRALTAAEIVGNLNGSSELVAKATDSGFIKTGSWSSYPGGYSGSYAHKAVGQAGEAKWTITVPTAGKYKVYATWVINANRAKNTPYTIVHANGSTTVRVNQEEDNEKWLRLGAFDFNAGPTTITVSTDAQVDGTETTYVIADAVKLVPARPASSTPIVIAPTAQYATQRLAQEGADYLERMTCETHDVVVGDGTTGLALGPAADFPNLDLASNFNPSDRMREDEFVLKGRPGGAAIVGVNEWATDQALWDFFYRLGYRHYGPGKNWELFPRVSNLLTLASALDVVEAPDYRYRLYAYDRGLGSEANALRFNDWRRHNRLDSGLTVRFNQGIGDGALALRANGQLAGYPPLVDYARTHPTATFMGGRDNSILQPNLCDPIVRQKIAEFAVQYFVANPTADSISMEPPDGYTTCAPAGCNPGADPLCMPSNQVVTLANEVAAAIQAAGYTNRYVGINTYSTHYAPPTIDLHPAVWVKIQENFDGVGGLSTEDAIEGWRARMPVGSRQQVAVGRYYSTWVWWFSMPGRATGSDLYTIKDAFLHDPRVRGVTTTIGGDWIDTGLGYYLSGRMILDVDGNFDALIDDFFTRSFGPVKAPVRAFFDELYRMREADPDIEHFFMSEDLVARLYRHLRDAVNLAPLDADVRARIDDLILYTRYLELRVDYLSTPSSATNTTARQAAFEQLLRHIYRVDGRQIINSYVLWTKLASLDPQIRVPLTGGATTVFEQWTRPPSEDALKDTRPFDRAEIDGFVANGVINNRLVTQLMTPVSFSDNLVPAAPVESTHLPDTESGITTRNDLSYEVWVPSGDTQVTLRIHPNVASPTTLELYSVGPNGARTLESRDQRIPVGQVDYTATLPTSHSGRHVLKVASTKQQVTLMWAGNAQVVASARVEDYWLPYNGGPWSMYFYVPRGTTQVGGYSLDNSAGRVLDASGASVLSFQDLYQQTGDAGFFTIPVPPGQDGKFWKFDRCSGGRVLYTVPPWLTRDDGRALLPAEVVTTDARPPTPWSSRFTKQLVPATPLNLPAVPTGSYGAAAYYSLANSREGYYTWLGSTAPVTFNVQVQAVADGWTAAVGLYGVTPSGEERLEAISTKTMTSAAPTTFSATLAPTTTGTHKVITSYTPTNRWITAGITSPPAPPITLQQGANAGWEFRDKWTMYFYVPKSATVIGGYYRWQGQNASGCHWEGPIPGPTPERPVPPPDNCLSGKLLGPDGTVAQLLDGSGVPVPDRNGNGVSDFSDFQQKDSSGQRTATDGYFQVAVSPADRGRLWQFKDSYGRRLLMTVPPYLARSASELLLPAEVVTADRP